MKTSDAGINLIKQFEGCKHEAYKDAVGVLTIGYGHTGPDVFMGSVWTQAACENALKADLMRFEDGVTQMVGSTLSQHQFDALVCFTYNVGLGNFRKSTMLTLLNKGDYADAADEFLRWDKAGGKVLPGLTRRREAERELFLS